MTALGVLCCFALFVCLTLLASFFLLSHLSLKICTCICYGEIIQCTMYMYELIHVHVNGVSSNDVVATERTEMETFF